MDIPDLVQQTLGDEEIQAGVSLGDEDAVCLTPTRTLVYTADGLLSDEQVEEFSHDVDRIDVSEGRRKTKFRLEYFDGTRSFTVPANRDEKVLELLLEGVLRVEEVIGERESLVGVYRFSELTLIIAEGRIIKLIGNQVWNEDFEVYPFSEVTGLEFERASVATSIVIAVDGRPQRVKVPNDTAPIVRQTIEQALFDYYDVGSLEELNRVVDDGSEDASEPETDDIDFGSGIDPLVTEDEATADPDEDALADISPGGASRPDESDDAGARESASESGTAGGGSATAETGDATSGEAAAERATETGDAAGGGSAGSVSDSGGATADDAGVDSTTADTAGTAGNETASPTDGATSGGDDSGTSAGDSAPTADDTEAAASGTGSSGTAASEAVEASHPETSDETSAAESTHQEAEDDGSGAGSASGDGPAGTGDSGGDHREPAGADGVQPATREDVVAVADRLEDLTEAVDRQNELLKRQHRAIKQLVEELQTE